MKTKIDQLNKEFGNKSPEVVLDYFIYKYGDRIALASSLGLEDQMLTDMIMKIKKDARVFTIDTGRLFSETYSLIDKTNMKYNFKMEVYFPESASVEKYVYANGINAFYESIDKRKSCCNVRKIRPLLRALSTVDVWICGLRKEQAVTRAEVKVVEWDEANQLVKVNPLARFSEEEVWEYILKNNVPYNALHKKGFPSIGCQPCTRVVKDGKDIRSGRWWWENPEHKECGLHRR